MPNLKGRVNSLEGGRKGQGMPIISVYAGVTYEEAWQKHLAIHPEDEKAEIQLVFNFLRARQDYYCTPPLRRPKPQERSKGPEPDPISITDSEDDEV